MSQTLAARWVAFCMHEACSGVDLVSASPVQQQTTTCTAPAWGLVYHGYGLVYVRQLNCWALHVAVSKDSVRACTANPSGVMTLQPVNGPIPALDCCKLADAWGSDLAAPAQTGSVRQQSVEQNGHIYKASIATAAYC